MDEQNIGIFERVLAIAEKYHITTILKAALYLVIIAFTFSFIAHPTWIFERWEQKKDEEHIVQVEKARAANITIQNEVEKLQLKSGADRVLLLQMHNSIKSLNNIPFIYCTATNEALKDGITPVGEQYSNVKLSLYPFADYLAENRYWMGTIEELQQIDKALGYRMLGNDARYVVAYYLIGDTPLGILMMTYEDVPDLTEDELLEVMRSSLVTIGVSLLSFNVPS